MLSEDERWELWNAHGVDEMSQKEADAFARAIEAAVLAKLQAQSEPVMWQYRFFDSHPDTVKTGTWSEWEEVKPRNPYTDTVQNRVDEFREYIKQGYKYELRALYTAPVQVGINGLTKEETDASASVVGLTAPVQAQGEPVAEIYQYVKGIYDYLASTSPDGVADEAFRLPPSATRAQRSLFNFVQSDAFRECTEVTRQDQKFGRKDGSVTKVTNPSHTTRSQKMRAAGFTRRPKGFNRREDSDEEKLQAQSEPVAYWIPKAEQFCLASPTGRPFAKAWEPLFAAPVQQEPNQLLENFDELKAQNKQLLEALKFARRCIGHPDNLSVVDAAIEQVEQK